MFYISLHPKDCLGVLRREGVLTSFILIWPISRLRDSRRAIYDTT